MARTSTKVKQRYKDKVYKRIPLDVKIAEYEQIKEYSVKTGESVNGFLRRMIRENAVIEKE